MKKHTEEVRKEICILHQSGLLVYRDGSVLLPRGRSYGSDSNGYKIVAHKGRYYRVHRLVAECFLPNPENKPEVDHINCNKSDNRVENLRWATRTEQMNFKDQDVQERKAKKHSKPVLQCNLDGNVIKIWPSAKECHRNGYDSGNVTKCCKNKFNRAGNNVYRGYIWKYA